MTTTLKTAGIVVLFAGGLALGYGQAGLRQAAPLRAGSYPAGDERLFIFVGSSTCGFSNDPDLAGLVQVLRSKLESGATADRRRLLSVGISKDLDVASGVAHLAQFGTFDEIAVGNNWANASLLRYVYGSFPGPAATPQVIVVDRKLSTDDGVLRVSDETILTRRVGLTELRDWANEGPGAFRSTAASTNSSR